MMREANDKEEAVEQLIADGLLREFARAGAGTDEAFVREVMGRIRSESPRRLLVFPSSMRKAILAAAACLILALGLWLMPARHPAPAMPSLGQVASVSGRIQVRTPAGSAAAAPGLDLHDGSRLTGGTSDARMAVRLSDGSELEIRGVFEAAVARKSSGLTVNMTAGLLKADVRPRPAGQPLLIASPHGTATVLGTKLSLEVRGELTRLEVESGHVRFVRTQDAKSVDVGAGQYVESNDPALERRALAEPTAQGLDAARPPIPANHTVVDVKTAGQLEAAVAALRDHTTIRLQAGTYRLSRMLVLDNVSDVAIRGAGGRFEDVTITGGAIDRGSGVVTLIDVRHAREVLVADLTLEGARNHAIHLHGESGSGAVSLFHCRLADCGEALLKTSAGVNNGRVEYSVFERTRIDAATGGDSAIKVLGGTNWVVRHTAFRNISAPVPSVNAYTFHAAAAFRDRSSGSVVEQCTFLNCDMAVSFGRAGPGDHQGGRIIGNVVVHERSLFDDRAVGPDGQTQRQWADAPITVWGSAGTEIAGNTILCNGNFKGAIHIRWPGAGTVVRGNRTDAPILALDGAEPVMDGNRRDAGAGLFVRFDPSGVRQISPPDASGKRRFMQAQGTEDLRLQEPIEAAKAIKEVQ